MTTRILTLLQLSFLFSVGMAACSGSVATADGQDAGQPATACVYTASPCSADPKPTDEQIKAAIDNCKETERTRGCVKESVDYGECVQANIVCSDTKKFDASATATATAAEQVRCHERRLHRSRGARRRLDLQLSNCS